MENRVGLSSLTLWSRQYKSKHTPPDAMLYIIRLTLSINNLMSKLDCTKVAVHMGVKCMNKTYSHSIFNQRLFLSFFQFLFLSFILFRNHRNTQQRKKMCEVKRRKKSSNSGICYSQQKFHLHARSRMWIASMDQTNKLN